MEVWLIIIILAGLFLFLWTGFQIRPKPFPKIASESIAPETKPLPAGLPVPVERFYRILYGVHIPVVETAVITGRGKVRIKGIRFPARFRFSHLAGKAYRHYIEVTFFGFPVMKINEHYIDGKSRLALPFGVSEGQKIDQGANLALWAEGVWMPSLWAADPQARWAAVDQTTALLYVPFKDGTEHFVLRFDRETGLLRMMESMRYKGEDSAQKTLWINQVIEWEVSAAQAVPGAAAITWFDEGAPWAEFLTEDVVYNLNLEQYIESDGP